MLRESICAALVLGGAAVQAGESSGFYVGGGLGQVSLQQDVLGFSINASDTAGKIFGGYQINRNLAVEATYIDIGSPKDTDGGITFGMTANVLQGSLRGLFPFNPTMAGYVKAGIIAWDATATATTGSSFASADDQSNGFSWGAGMQFDVNKNTQIRLEYEGATVSDIDFRLISAGIAWVFR